MTNHNPHQRLLFDKLAFTLPIQEELKMALIDRINEPAFYEPYNRRVYRNTGKGYKNNYQFDIHEGNTIELSLYPKNTKHNFLRVEYNPDKLGKAGRKSLRKFLLKLLGLEITKTIYFQATVTRLDLTLDVFDMEPDLYPHKSKVSYSQLFRDDEGFITSQVIGSDESDIRITLYDKNAEQGNEKELSPAYNRVEVRFRNLSCSMAELNMQLLSVLKRLNFFTSDFLLDKRFSKRFRNNASKHGLNRALKLSADNRRRRYRRYLQDYRAYPIDLKKLNCDFKSAHKKALGSLLNKKYRDEYYS